MGAPKNETRSSRVVSAQVHSRTRVSWLLLAGRSRDHLSLDSGAMAALWPAPAPENPDDKRDRAAGLGPVPRSPRSEHRPGSASRSGGPALGAASSQAPRDWDHRTRPSSRSRWRKLPERREGASACCFPPAGRAGRRGGARAPEAIVGARSEHPRRGAPRRGLGSPRSPVHPEPRASPGVDLGSYGRTARPAVPRGAAGPPGLRR